MVDNSMGEEQEDQEDINHLPFSYGSKISKKTTKS
jgi:hypothetical protein